MSRLKIPKIMLMLSTVVWGGNEIQHGYYDINKIGYFARDFSYPEWGQMLYMRDLSSLLNISTTAPAPAGEMAFHADVADSILEAGPFDAFIFYGNGFDASWGFSDAYLLGTPGYENTFEAVAPTPANGLFNVGLQARMTLESEPITVTQGPVNWANTFPAPYHLSVCDEPLGDETSGNTNLDIADVAIASSEEMVYATMTNNIDASGFPTGGYFGPWYMYIVGFLNPESEDSTMYGLVYANGAFGQLSPGLWKFFLNQMDDPTNAMEKIGEIQYSISGNVLSMSANWEDIFSDPDFGPWPNELELLGMTAVTVEVTATNSTIGDDIDPLGFFPGIQTFVIGENTSPIIANHGMETISDTAGTFEIEIFCNYQDDDNHFPLYPMLYIDGAETGMEMISGDHYYADGSLFTMGVTLQSGTHTYSLGFFDGMDWAVVEEVTFNLGDQQHYILYHSAGWNMVGLSLETENANHLNVFPEAVEGTLYSFEDSYVLEDDLIPGTGYWLRFNNPDNDTIFGLTINELSIALNEDWNMIAGISTEINVNSIIDPDGLIIPGTIYSYNPNGYYNAETIAPGKGYWLRSYGDGNITISTTAMIKTPLFLDLMEDANTININGVTLYFGVKVPEEQKFSYSLPPKPPGQSFDVRFSGDWKYIENSGTIEITGNIKTTKISYSIVDQINWELKIPDALETFILTGSGKFEIDGNVNIMELNKLVEIPEIYDLSQNFPNPFNSITKINYILPKKSQVTIKVYNIFGQQVAELVSGIQNAGSHQVIWNGANLNGKPVASGVYIYMIITEDFTKVKKMVLMK